MEALEGGVMMIIIHDTSILPKGREDVGGID
jgi:hypothetical protein